jgi:hypothetical protein
MPTVSRFFGIEIKFHFDDHNPPHFHAVYGEYEALISIESLELLRGELPRRAFLLVLEWALLHRNELREDWEFARTKCPLHNIEPLD